MARHSKVAAVGRTGVAGGRQDVAVGRNDVAAGQPDPAAAESRCAPEPLAQLAEDHARHALAALVEIAIEGGSEAARVSAANAILDRAFGKPLPGSQAQSPGPAGPTLTAAELTDDELARIAASGSPGAAAPEAGP